MSTSPDCRDGNHNKCDGTAWDLEQDAPTRCTCPHHIKTTPVHAPTTTPTYTPTPGSYQPQATPDKRT